MSGGSLTASLTARVGPLVIDVEFDTAPGTLVVVGPNGAGKTSLLSLLLGVLPAVRARVAIGGTMLSDTDAGIVVPLEERRLGYVPQDYALFPHLTVRENVTFALASARPELARGARDDRVQGLLAELGLEEQAARRPETLSGGERQRLALSRALAADPRALLLDEPLAALDVHSRDEVREFLGTYLERLALPTLVVTHDAADARRLGHRIAVLEAGRITQSGTWSEIADNPGSPFVERFLFERR